MSNDNKSTFDEFMEDHEQKVLFEKEYKDFGQSESFLEKEKEFQKIINVISCTKITR